MLVPEFDCVKAESTPSWKSVDLDSGAGRTLGQRGILNWLPSLDLKGLDIRPVVLGLHSLKL